MGLLDHRGKSEIVGWRSWEDMGESQILCLILGWSDKTWVSMGKTRVEEAQNPLWLFIKWGA